MWNDLRYSLRALRRSPLLTAAAVLSLALGIGANTAIFSLVHRLLIQPVPVPEAERLVGVFTLDEAQAGTPMGTRLPVSYPNFEDLRRGAGPVFSHFVAVLGLPLAVTGGARPERVDAQLVSEGYFAMMGLEAERGRFFLPAEEAAGGPPVAVLSHGFWQRYFGGDPDVVGGTVRLNGAPYEVVGVAPDSFRGTGLFTPQVWVPLALREQLLTGVFRSFFDVRRALLLNVFGKLAPGATAAQAEQSLGAVAARLAAEYPDANQGRDVAVLPLAQANVPPNLRELFVRAGGVLSAVVGLVLLIACANVANLLLARGQARRGEIGLRLSLGVTRWRLVRQLLIDGLVLALVSGALGLLTARWMRDLLWSQRPPLFAQLTPDLGLHLPVLAVSLLVSVATGIVFALAPAAQVLRLDVREVVRTGRGEAAGANRPWNLRSLLIVGQVAVSVVALVGSALFLASLGRLESIDPGFAADRLAALSFNPAALGYPPERVRELQERALEAAAADPAVTSATLSTVRPLGPFPGVQRTVIPEGGGGSTPDEGLLTAVDAVAPGYFATFGTPIVRGRPLGEIDREGSRPVAVVNETLAARLWPGQDPIGRRFAFSGDPVAREVVGVVADRKYTSVGEDPLPYLHLPLAQSPSDFVNLYVRTAGDPGAVLEGVRRRVQALDPDLPLTDVATMREVVDASLWAPRLAAILLGLFGLLALLLTAVGIYGVIAYTTARRSRELGIRMALGADRRRVVGLVVRQGMALVAAGLVVGLLAAAWLSNLPWLDGLLYGRRGLEPTSFAAAALVLAAIALLANVLPARRATAADPVGVLRAE